MNLWNSIWDVIWFFFWIYVFFAYLMVLFSIIGDIFRDRSLHGAVKAIWILFLIFLPILTALVYLIARGRGMAERGAYSAAANRAATDDYIRSVASASPADEIGKAKSLLDGGTITQEEYAILKRRALEQG
jgi:hypothetical protein